MTKTPFIGLNRPDFNTSPWSDEMNANFSMIDETLRLLFGVVDFKGEWQNSINVTSGDRFFDSATNVFYRAVVTHVSAASPTTFAQDRAANPSYWILLESASRDPQSDYDVLSLQNLVNASEIVIKDFADDTQYLNYKVIITEAKGGPGLSEGATFAMEWSNDNGATWQTGADYYEYEVNSSATTLNSASASSIPLAAVGLKVGADTSFDIEMVIEQSDRDIRRTTMRWDGHIIRSSDARADRIQGIASQKAASIINGIRIRPSSGTIIAKVLITGLRDNGLI